jgi:hypothetical protein
LELDESVFVAKTEPEKCSEDNLHVNDVISKLDLSELERAVLNGFLQSKHNSKTSLGLGTFAKNLINPSTGKPYSRAGLSLAWNRIKDKISNFCDHSKCLKKVV